MTAKQVHETILARCGSEDVYKVAVTLANRGLSLMGRDIKDCFRDAGLLSQDYDVLDPRLLFGFAQLGAKLELVEGWPTPEFPPEIVQRIKQGF